MKLKKLLLGLCLIITNSLFSQTLTISSTGETGTSGTNWSVTGGTLTVSGTANISASVILTEMVSSDLTVVSSSSTSLSVLINEAITSSTSGKSLTIGATSYTGTITINQPISIDGGLTMFGNKVIINNDITTTNVTSGNIAINAYGTTPPISGNGNINIASGRTLTLNTSSSNATSTLGGVISGTNSILFVSTSGTSGGIVLTQNNLFTGNTIISNGVLTLRNDAPNPASKAFFGNGTLKIEPSSASFTNTFSNSGYSFFMEYLTIGKLNNNSDVSIDTNISLLRNTTIYCNTLNLNANIAGTSGSGASVQIYCINPLINVTGTRTISATSIAGINAPMGSPFSSDLTYPIPNLTITGGLWIELGGSYNTTKNVIINSNITNTGGFIITGANIQLNGNIVSPSNKLITLNGITTVASGKYIQCGGNFTQNGNITFKSDATGTAAFGPLGGTYSITSGTVTTERYIPARRAFRFLSPSVTTTTTIKQNWQENGGTTAGLGTHITGTGGATNGFDVTGTNNPSMFTFDNGSWVAVANTNVNVLNAGTPYRLMVRGDRTTDLTTNSPTATSTTLRATGILKTGNFVPTINQTADGFSLVGNPYQAPIDIKAILTASSNMSSGVVYYWDPTLNVRGGYVTRNLTTNVNDVTSSFNQYVQPGQAVFVKRDNTANVASVTITESHKSVANGAAGVFRMTTSNDYGLLRVNLQANTNNQWQNIEGTLALFNDNFSWNVTQEDATKMSNLDEEVSFVQNNTSLAIACLSAPSGNSELPIQLNNLRQSNYQWQFELNNYGGATPYLFDTQNNTYTEITNGTTVPFTATTTAGNRFKIVFQPSALNTDDFENSLVVYPNPAKAGSSFYIQGITVAEVTVYNVLGQNIPVDVKLQGDALQVTPTQTLSQGIYLVTVTTEGKTQQLKWIVE